MPKLPKKNALALNRVLNEMTLNNPGVAAAAADIAYTKKRVQEGRAHPIPCTIENCEWHTP